MLKRFLLYGIACCFACISAFAIPAARADDGNKEYLIKAAFIYNFIKYVEWPGSAAVSSNPSIDVCTIGQSGLDDTGSVFKAASSSSLALKLVGESNPRDAAKHCHVLFIAQSEESRLGSILAALKGQPVLTVSDIDGFADHGGMIGFTTEDNKIKLVINTRPASAAGLRIDAQLLAIAVKVIGR